MTNIDDEELLESELENQIPEANDETQEASIQEGNSMQENKPKNAASQYLGTKLQHEPGKVPGIDTDDKELAVKKGLSKVGDKLSVQNEIRDGWIDVDKALLGQRAMFYPETWSFKIRPATVEAIRNWSTIDDENPNSIDDVFNEILKSCISISTPNGPIPWGNINSWDRFFFLLLIREYTFVNGETNIKYEIDCPECENKVPFKLESQALLYDYPDSDLMNYYDGDTKIWTIDPAEFDIENEDVINLYIPTLEKDANIKAWMISKIQENRNKKIDNVFIKFLPWLSPKISKDTTIASRQIKELEIKYKSWDIDMFSFMDDVIRNIIITPSTKLISKCPVCGEEVTSDIQFPNTIRDLFNISNRHKKFGKK